MPTSRRRSAASTSRRGSANKNLPQLTTLGTLATSLAKAINTKPLVTQSNRVDELGELAAVLVTDSLGIAGGNTPAALAAIGTSIYKAASAKLLADTGNNAADLSDIARDVAGAIAQTIAHATTLTSSGPGGLTIAEKTSLLSATGTGTLIKLLSTGAKTYASQVNLDEVNGIRITAPSISSATRKPPSSSASTPALTGTSPAPRPSARTAPPRLASSASSRSATWSIARPRRRTCKRGPHSPPLRSDLDEKPASGSGGNSCRWRNITRPACAARGPGSARAPRARFGALDRIAARTLNVKALSGFMRSTGRSAGRRPGHAGRVRSRAFAPAAASAPATQFASGLKASSFPKS